MRWFGVVQYIGNDRMEDWTEFYRELFGFVPLPDEQRYGILPKGRILRSPDGSFFLQLIEPKPGILGHGAREIAAARRPRYARRARDRERAARARRRRSSSRGRALGPAGALTQSYLGGAMFELVHDERSELHRPSTSTISAWTPSRSRARCRKARRRCATRLLAGHAVGARHRRHDGGIEPRPRACATAACA
jgi:hypothetical protein